MIDALFVLMAQALNLFARPYVWVMPNGLRHFGPSDRLDRRDRDFDSESA